MDAYDDQDGVVRKPKCFWNVIEDVKKWAESFSDSVSAMEKLWIPSNLIINKQ